MSVKLEPHNVTGYGAVTEEFKTKNRTALIRPTGTGKSFVVLKLIEDNEGKKVIYLAPSRPILQQLRNNMKQNGIKYKDANNKKLVEEYTYQKLLSMLKNDELHLEADYIILDEFHHCGAPEWGLAVEDLLRQNPNAKVLGLSATPIRYFDETIRDMAEELFGNNIADEMNIAEAIEQGILKEPVYTTGIYDATEIMREYEEKVDKCRDEEKKKVAKEYLKDLRSALDTTVQGLPELLANSMTNPEGKYVVFCKNIEDMQKKMAEAQKMFGKVNSQMELYSVSSKKYDDEGNEIEISETENTRQLKKFEKSPENGKLKLLFSVDMLSEGWHYLGLDGVVMMRPTSSPTLFAQQLGRGLSIGGDKQPIIIDLVNNADSIRVIENFYREFGNGDKKVHSVLSGIKISREMRDATEIIKKVDSLIQRKEYLTYEEKLELMLDYIKSIEGTDEKFTSDSQYKGYNLGHMRANLRANYWNGALKIDDELLQKFIDAGIIIEKPERVRTTAQQKYDFLVSMIGKDEEELKSAKMESGLSYTDARAWIQHQYNSGKLDLNPEQIETLKDNGLLRLSANEIKGLESKYGISSRDVKKISNEYGDIDEFMEKFKRGEIDYKFLAGTFVGSTEIVVSEKDLTVRQKKAYIDLVDKMYALYITYESDKKRIINIDVLDKIIQELREIDKDIIIKRYGLDGGKAYTCDEIGKLYGISGGAISNRTLNIIKHIRRSFYRRRGNKDVITWDSDMKELNESEDKLKKEEEKIDSFEKLLIYLSEQVEPYAYINTQELSKLNLDLSDNQIKTLQLYFDNNLCSRDDVEVYLQDFYKKDLEKHIKERRDVEASKRYHERFMEIYSELEEDYMENEDIFNPDSIITGRKIREIEAENEKKESVFNVNMFSISTLCKARLRQAGNETIKRIFNSTKEGEKEFVNALKGIGLDDYDIEELVENYYIEEHEDETKGVDTLIEDLELNIRAYNCIKRAGIKTVEELLERIQTEGDFLKIRNLGHKSMKEIIDVIHKLGYKFTYETEEVSEKEDSIDVGKQKQSTIDILDTGKKKKEQKKKDEQIERKEDEQEEQKEDEQEEQIQDEQKEQKEDEQEEQIQDEQQESNLKKEYEGLASQILECDTEYAELQKSEEVLNLKRENVERKIEELINQINETSSNNVTQTVALTLMKAFDLVQEQKSLLKEIDEKLNEMKEVEKANREKRDEFTKRLTEIIRGGE